MNPITHLFISWSIANIDSLERRDRLMVTIGGLLPDIDAIGIIPELISGGKIDWYSKYHHILAHNFMPCVLGLIPVILIARKRFLTAILFTLAFHIHLFCDVIGARGPEGYQWPIPYLWPFNPDFQITWSHQWLVNAWQNMVITVVFIIIVIWLARVKGYSIFSLVSEKADKLIGLNKHELHESGKSHE